MKTVKAKPYKPNIFIVHFNTGLTLTYHQAENGMYSGEIRDASGEFYCGATRDTAARIQQWSCEMGLIEEK